MTLLDDAKTVHDTTTDVHAKAILEPHIKESIEVQLRLLVHFRMRCWLLDSRYSYEMGRHHESDISYDKDHAAQKVRDQISKSWSETLRKYLDICETLGLGSMMTAEQVAALGM